EVGQDFPLHRSVTNTLCACQLTVLDRVSPEKRLALGEAEIKGWLATECGEPRISAEAAEMLHAFHMQSGLAGMRLIVQDTMTLRPQARKALRAEVFKVLESMLGTDRQREDASLWTFTTPMRRWTMKTRVWIVAGSFSQPWHLNCEHFAFLPEGRVA